MPKVVIKDFGPIKEAEFETKKVTVLIGNQSSGKSTIAKVISFFSWLEKEALLRQELSFINPDFIKKQLLSFHKITSYVNDNSYIEYKSSVICIKYTKELVEADWSDSNANRSNKLAKIAYVPSTRNLAAIPNIEILPVSHDNIRSFVFDWLNIRKKYTHENKIKILNLGVSYYYNERGVADTIVLDESGKEMPFDEVSSGFQSLIPLFIWIDYLTTWIYQNAPDTTYEKAQLKMDSIFSAISSEIGALDETKGEIEQFNEHLGALAKAIKVDNTNIELATNDAISAKAFNLFSLMKNISSVHYSNLIIEEPEQNLFPKTQRDLVYHLLDAIKHEERNHKLVLTTHSPYILYALNNCMMGGLVKDKIASDELENILTRHSFINPQLVSAYKIENGYVSSIQNSDGLIGENYFDEIMKEVMDDYYELLEYYGEHE